MELEGPYKGLLGCRLFLMFQIDQLQFALLGVWPFAATITVWFEKPAAEQALNID